MVTLKPLDVVVALKVGLNEKAIRPYLRDEEVGLVGGLLDDGVRTNSVGDLAADLCKGRADISRSINRLMTIGLIGERRLKSGDILSSNRKRYSLQRSAMSDFLCFGIRYIFSPEKLGHGRGVPTGWSCPLIRSPMNQPSIGLVWASPNGSAQGELLEPLYAAAPDAALKDPGLYALLSLVDVVRTGKPRELTYAKDMLVAKIEDLYS